MKDYVVTYYLFINALALIVSGIDKMKAKHAKWRIKENTLYMLSFLGGAFGMFLSLTLFRHKTQKRIFKRIIALTLAMHVFILGLVLYKDLL